MQCSFTPPKALNDFVLSLSTLPPAVPITPPPPWPDETAGMTQPARTHYPPSPAWLAARDAYINHVMTCHNCVTGCVPVSRHCAEGAALRARYDAVRC